LATKKAIKALADATMVIRTKTHRRLCDAIYAAMDDRNIQDRPTRQDLYVRVRRECDLRNKVSAAAKEKRIQEKHYLEEHQLSLF
jgi:hypothetical protein